MKQRISILLILALSLISFRAEYAHASATITTPATANVSSDSATGASVALPTIVVTEGAAGDIATGTHTFTLPTGYIFDTSSTPTVTCTGTSCVVGSITFTGNTALNVPINTASSAAGTLNIGTSSTMKVKASAGTPMAAAGNITMTAGTITGLSSSSNFGTLTQVVGAANKLAFTIQPPASNVAGSTFTITPQVSIQDQFGNLRSADATALTVAAMEGTSTTISAPGTLSGTLTQSAVAGVASFSGLSYNIVDTISLKATGSGLTTAYSTTTSITSGSGTSVAAALPPSSTIVSPTTSLTVTPGSSVVITGTTKQGSSSSIQSIQISFDGGNTWQQAQAVNGSYANWQYVWNVPNTASGTYNIKTMATDWLGKVETPSAGIMIAVQAATPATPVTPNPVPGNPLTITPAPALNVTLSFPPGTILQANGNPTVYMFVNNQLQPFTSYAVFKARGLSAQNIVNVDPSQISQFTIGAPVVLSNGFLIKGSGPTVYIVTNGGKSPIPSMKYLRKVLKMTLKNLVKLTDSDLAAYPLMPMQGQ